MRATASELTDCTRVDATWLNWPYLWRSAVFACAACVSCWAWAISFLCDVIVLVVSTYAATPITSAASTPMSTYEPLPALPLATYGRALCGRRLTGLMPPLQARARRPRCGGADPRR